MCRSKVQSVGNPTASLPPSLLLVAIMLIFAFDRGLGRKKKASATRERARERSETEKWEKWKWNVFHTWMRANAFAPKAGAVAGAWHDDKAARGQSWAAIESFFYVWWKRVCCCSVAQLLESRKMWEIHGNNFSLLKALKVAVAESRSRSRLWDEAPRSFSFFFL